MKSEFEPYPVMDEGDVRVSDMRESALRVMEFFKSSMRIFVQYRGDRELALHAFCLAFGWNDLVECETAKDVAIKLYGNPKRKAAVTKAVKLFQDAKNIPPMSGQRPESGRKTMPMASLISAGLIIPATRRRGLRLMRRCS